MMNHKTNMSNKPNEIFGETFASEAKAQAWCKDELRKLIGSGDKIVAVDARIPIER